MEEIDRARVMGLSTVSEGMSRRKPMAARREGRIALGTGGVVREVCGVGGTWYIVMEVGVPMLGMAWVGTHSGTQQGAFPGRVVRLPQRHISRWGPGCWRREQLQRDATASERRAAALTHPPLRASPQGWSSVSLPPRPSRPPRPPPPSRPPPSPPSRPPPSPARPSPPRWPPSPT